MKIYLFAVAKTNILLEDSETIELLHKTRSVQSIAQGQGRVMASQRFVVLLLSTRPTPLTAAYLACQGQATR